ncbi:MAG: HipA N-terminal domain-containing protein [bacterium]|nr:HipA N-terminal domain-containing protein [bacterium]
MYKQVLVFAQTKTQRMPVGTLWRSDQGFHFCYDSSYLKRSNALPVGPELPLKPPLFTSSELFASFADRIPSKRNPAYPDYCAQWGISDTETDVLVLLSTIGHRGPSSFLFRLKYHDNFSEIEFKQFRIELGLTVRDFASLLDVSPSTITMTEKGNLKSKWLLDYCEILRQFPDTLGFQLKKRGMFLHDDKIQLVKAFIRKVA